MATRFYFDRTNAPAVTPPAGGAEWEHSASAIVRRLNSPTGTSVLSNLDITYDAADDLVDKDALFGQFVSAPLAAQTIAAQTLSLQVLALEPFPSNNLFLTWKVYLIDSAGAAVGGGTILAIRRDATEVSGAGFVNRGDSATSTSVTASTNDRIVVELGLAGLPTASASVDGHNGSLKIGEDGASGDLPVDDTTTTTTYNAWINFANTITFFSMPPRPRIVRQAAQRAAAR